MRWLKQLLGLEVAPDPTTEGWGSASGSTRARTTLVYLAAVAQRAGLTGAVVSPRPEDEGAQLTGTIHGFPIRLTVTDVGTTTGDLGLRCALTASSIDLEYDPEWATNAAAEGEDAPKRVMFAPAIFVGVPHAPCRTSGARALRNGDPPDPGEGVRTVPLRLNGPGVVRARGVVRVWSGCGCGGGGGIALPERTNAANRRVLPCVATGP